jgi:DNA repair protein RadC
MSALDLFKLAEVELAYRSTVKPSERPKVTMSRDAYDLFLNNWDKSNLEFREEAKLLLLNRNARALGIYNISSGGTAGTYVDPKHVYMAALKTNASSIILAHNHPSGNLEPSDADIKLTRKLAEAGKVLEITLLDHLVVTSEGYYSFADEGRLTP